jgi:hypothetical protein
MGFQALVAPFRASNASANSVRCVGSDALTRRPKGAVFNLAPCLAGLTEDFGAFVDCSGALAALQVLLDPLRALVSPAALSNSLGLPGWRVRRRPSRFELILGFGGDKLAFLLPPGIPEPFAAFPGPAPTNVGAKFSSFKLVAVMVLFYLILAGWRMLCGKKVMSPDFFC